MSMLRSGRCSECYGNGCERCDFSGECLSELGGEVVELIELVLERREQRKREREDELRGKTTG